jgi:hypothetical protein
MLEKDQNKRIDIDQVYQALEDINVLKQLKFKKSIESNNKNNGK